MDETRRQKPLTQQNKLKHSKYVLMLSYYDKITSLNFIRVLSISKRC